MIKQLKGVIPALVTPMDKNGNILHGALTKQVSYLVSAGVDGLFVNGSSGEGAYLALEEKIETIRTAKESAGESVCICAASLQSNVRSVLDEFRQMETEPVDFFVAIAPYYYGMSDEAVREHFLTIADTVSKPLIVNNIPGCTHNPISLENLRTFEQHENIVGVKDSTGDFSLFSRCLLGRKRKTFSWIQGEDFLDAQSFCIGAEGVVSGLANVYAEPYVSMYQAFHENDIPAMLDAQRAINDIYEQFVASGYDNIPFIKAACEILGRGSRYMRQTGLTLSEEDFRKVEAILNSCGQ